MNVVVDSNIIFSALLRSPNRYCDTIFLSGDEFFTPKFMFVELFKYKERIENYSQLSETELLEMLYRVALNLHFFDESLISTRNYLRAFQLVKDSDRKDLVFVALTLEISGQLWTADQELTRGLRAGGFTDFYTP